jgi:hypothetical protein
MLKRESYQAYCGGGRVKYRYRYEKIWNLRIKNASSQSFFIPGTVFNWSV